MYVFGEKSHANTETLLLLLFDGYYTGKPVLASTPSQEMEDFVGAKFY